jgi:dihydropteroate synthase
MIWRAREHVFSFPRPTALMGVLNVTPDSFSDGGKFLNVEAAISRGLELVAEGAEIIDVGGESTRPKATPVPEEEELRRVLPVIKGLAAQTRTAISIDTMKPAVARAAIQAGASIVNDVAANRSSTEMWELIAETSAGYVLMHMQGEPATMQLSPFYENVLGEVDEFFTEKLQSIRKAGVAREQIVLDVGIGFGKSIEHNLELVANQRRFLEFGRPLALGVSRKSFLGKLLNCEVEERLSAALACSSWAAGQGVNILRTHDVKETLRAVRMTEELARRTQA